MCVFTTIDIIGWLYLRYKFLPPILKATEHKYKMEADYYGVLLLNAITSQAILRKLEVVASDISIRHRLTDGCRCNIGNDERRNCGLAIRLSSRFNRERYETVGIGLPAAIVYHHFRSVALCAFD